jgi:hypothetical protein
MAMITDKEADALVTRLASEAVEHFDAVLVIGVRVEENGEVGCYVESQGRGGRGGFEVARAMRRQLATVDQAVAISISVAEANADVKRAKN